MCKNKIITKVTEPTEWVNSLVIVEKPNKLRICLDPKHLNSSIKRSHYPMPTIEEVINDLSDVKYFSVFDAKDGYWHVKLTERSSKLTTFNTPFGRYRWLRMPFGIKSASEEFQRRMHEALEGLDGVQVIVDDILVYGRGQDEASAIEDHDQNVIKLLERLKVKNIKLNPKKISFKQKQVKYMGHKLTDQGVKADEEKITAIKNMKTPQNLAELKTFLGMVTYLGKFLPNLSQETECLRQLEKKEVAWHWIEQHDAAVKRIKELVC